MLDSPTVPSVDFWLDWRPTASVDGLRRILPASAAAAGLGVVERELVSSGPEWAHFDLLDPAAGQGPVGSMRAQALPDGTQLLVTPANRRDEAALAALNRGALALYCGLLARGLLAPPPPLETPDRPLVPPEA